jgi:hypothetical protein
MAEANVGIITSQFPNIFEAPFSGQGDIESVEKKDVPVVGEKIEVARTPENIEKTAEVEQEAIALKEEKVKENIEEYKDFVPTERFRIGKKDYLVMNAEGGFESLLPYEQLYILEDQGVDVSDPKFDSLKKQAEDYREGNVMFPGYTDSIPYYPTDPRYAEIYKAQVDEVNDMTIKQTDPIAYHTNGFVNRETMKAYAALLGPALTVAGRQFLLGGMAAQAVPGIGTAAGTTAMGVGTGLTFAGMYLSGLTSGSLSSAAAGQVYDNINRVLRDDFEGFGDIDENTKNALRDFSSEFMWTSGADSLAGVVRYFGPAGIKKLTSLGRYQSKQLQQYADDLGIKLSPIHFSNDVTKGTSKILGVFPLINYAFKKGGKDSQTELLKWMNSFIGTYGNTMSLNNVGINILQAAKTNKKLGGKSVEEAYKLFEKIGSKINAPIVKGNNMMALLDDEITKQAARAGDQGMSEYFETFLQVRNSPYFKDSLDDLSRILKRQGGLTITQAREYQKMINESLGEYIKKSGKTDFTNAEASALLKFKEGLEKDIQSIKLSDIPEEFKELGGQAIGALNNANNLAAKWASTFNEGVMAKAIGQGDIAYKLNLGPNIYKSGATSRQKFYKNLFATMKDDPEAMVDLRKIVGDKEFDNAIGSWINDTYASSFKKGVKRDPTSGSVLMGETLEANAFDPFKFEKSLGLDTPQGREALTKAIGETRVSALDKFMDLAKAVEDVPVGDSSTFVGRRVTFEGMKGLTALASVGGAGMLGAGLTTGGVGAIVAGATKILLTFGAFDFINRPKNLKRITDWFERNIGAATLSRKALAEFEQIMVDVGVPTEAEDAKAYQEAKAFKKIMEEGSQVETSTKTGRTGAQERVQEKKETEQQESINILDILNQQDQTTSTMPTEMQTNVFQPPSGLTGQANPATYASLFPFDTTGQQAAMSQNQQPRIAAQGGLGALLGFKGAS